MKKIIAPIVVTRAPHPTEESAGAKAYRENYHAAMIVEGRMMLKHINPESRRGIELAVMGGLRAAFNHDVLAGLKLYDEWASGKLTDGVQSPGYHPQDAAKAWNRQTRGNRTAWKAILATAQLNGYVFSMERALESIRR